jgi:hypothetical protein
MYLYVCVCGLLFIAIAVKGKMHFTLAFKEHNKNKHAASWPPALALSDISLNGTCILPGGAPTHRRWHFNKGENEVTSWATYFTILRAFWKPWRARKNSIASFCVNSRLAPTQRNWSKIHLVVQNTVNACYLVR